jgi:hypothetical protein
MNENRFDKAAEGIYLARQAADRISSLADSLREACEQFEAGAMAARDGTDRDIIGGQLLLEVRRAEKLRLVLREQSTASFCLSAKRVLQAAWETLP